MNCPCLLVVLPDPPRLPAFVGLLCREGPGLRPTVPEHNLFDRLATHGTRLVRWVAQRNQAVDLVVFRNAHGRQQFLGMGERQIENGAAQTQRPCRQEEILDGGKYASAWRRMSPAQTADGHNDGDLCQVMG